MKRLFINGTRSGYTPNQCGETLTVGELVEILQQYDEDMKVYLSNDNGYTYGHLSCDYGYEPGIWVSEETFIDDEELEEE